MGGRTLLAEERGGDDRPKIDIVSQQYAGHLDRLAVPDNLGSKARRRAFRELQGVRSHFDAGYATYCHIAANVSDRDQLQFPTEVKTAERVIFAPSCNDSQMQHDPDVYESASAIGKRTMTGLLIFVAAAATGGLLGFLFGIPRVLQSNDQGASNSPAPRLLINTNLEQVSDWLTKILVGIGLVEFTRIIDSSGALFTTLGAAFAPREDAAVLAGTTVVAGVVLGFLGGYVVTRTRLTRIFHKADLSTIENMVKEEVSKRTSLDGDAMRLVMQQLDGDEPVIEVNRLAQALGSASSTARAQVFQLASTQRRTFWRTSDGKPKMMRTIPVLQALTRVDPHDHRYWGELGFALAEQTPPDDGAAVDVLTTAIERRDNAGDTGWQLYEFVRAQARLRALNGAAPDAATRELVLADARTAMARPSIRKIIESAPPSNGRDVVGTIRGYLDQRPQVRVGTKPEN